MKIEFTIVSLKIDPASPQVDFKMSFDSSRSIVIVQCIHIRVEIPLEDEIRRAGIQHRGECL